METPIGKEPGNWEKTPGRTAGLRDWPGMSDNTTQIQNSPLLAPGTGSLRRRQSFALLARVVRAAGKILRSRLGYFAQQAKAPRTN